MALSSVISACKSLAKLSLSQSQVPNVRSYRNVPRLRLPQWFVPRDCATSYDHITRENREFINEIVKDELQETLAKNNQVLKTTSPLNDDFIASGKWNSNTRRTGLIAKKIGAYPLWSKEGKRIPTTLLQIVENHVVKYIPSDKWTPMIYKKRESDLPKKKMGCLLVGSETIDPTRITKTYHNIFKTHGVAPKKNLCRFIISPEAALPSGTPLYANHFQVGDFIDIRGNTIYRGFQGVMKRWGFSGMPASHGVTKTHRRPGNIGGGGEKGRVWPGKKMPGHMGNRWRTIRGAQILRINTKYNVIWVKGFCAPGPVNGLCYLYDTILPLRRRKTPPAFPTYVPTGTEEEEIYEDSIHQFNSPSVTFTET